MLLEVGRQNISENLEALSRTFESRAIKHDKEGSFVFNNYKDLKNQQVFSAMIPSILGGGGMKYTEMCQLIRQIGASCGSTALALAMHQHLVAANRWKFENKDLGAKLLEKIAQEELILVSTGARDWLSSNGTMKKTNGGYLFSATKSFASGSLVGDIAITSAPYHDPKEGNQVLHFPVPLLSEGIFISEDWQVLGMRGTGSHSIQFHEVFIPEEKITLKRPQGGFHPIWDVVLTVAMPLIMSAYVGIAERARDIALNIVQRKSKTHSYEPYALGKLNNEMVAAQVQWEEMQRLVNHFDFSPDRLATSKTLGLKTNVSEACMKVLQLALEVVGGQGFYERNILERLFRDMQAAQFHPLPKWDQYRFSSDLSLEKNN